MSYLPLILEPNLTHRHTPILLQVAPGRIHNGDVIFFVSVNTVRLGQLRAVGQQLCSHLPPVFAFW
jgi:uroporphyrinogen-III synthase